MSFPRPLAFAGLTAVAAVATLGAILVADGNVGLALAPLAAMLAIWALWKLPLRLSALGLLAVVLCVDYVAERPFEERWQSPFYRLGHLVFSNLNKLTGFPPLRFPLLDLALVSLLALIAYRRATRDPTDGPGVPSARVLAGGIFVSFATLMALELFGIARGGNFKESLWQFHQMGFLSIIAVIFLHALRGPRDYRALARIIIFAACFKALEGIYFIYFVARPQGFITEFTTSHSDSILFVTATVMGVAMWTETPTWASARRSLAFLPIVQWGMYLNDRRLATVSLGLSLGLLFLLMRPSRLKRWFLRRALLAIPVTAVYFAVGWGSSAGVFAPVKLVRSMLEGDKVAEGPDYRDQENFNLLVTWMKNPVIGSGFGHEFEEPVKMPDISFVMPNYRYQPHNTILWLWGIGGLVGFFFIFVQITIGLYLAARAYRFARVPAERVAALTAISAFVAHLVQCLGDMGTISWIGSFFVGIGLAAMGQLAVSTGAWPAPRAHLTSSPTLVEGALHP